MRIEMRCLFTLTVLACVAVTNSCFLLVPRINYDLTASVAGVVGKADIHEVVGDYYADHHESFWRNFSNQRRQLLRVRLSTSRDLVVFANKKGVLIFVQWYFCGKPEQEVYLGQQSVFVAGEVVPSIPRRPSPVVADRLGRFSYDAVLYPRGWFMSETGKIEGKFDLQRETTDVCVQVRLVTKMGGYRTNVARIPAQAIAAALGVDVPSATAQPSGPQQ